MKEYFTTSYEEKRKEKLIQLSETYDKLLSSYKSYNPDDSRDATIISGLETKLENFNKELIDELNKSADMIEEQIEIYENKLDELTALRDKLTGLTEDNGDIVTFTSNLEETQKLNKEYTTRNLILLVLCCILIIVLIMLNIM